MYVKNGNTCGTIYDRYDKTDWLKIMKSSRGQLLALSGLRLVSSEEGEKCKCLVFGQVLG